MILQRFYLPEKKGFKMIDKFFETIFKATYRLDFMIFFLGIIILGLVGIVFFQLHLSSLIVGAIFLFNGLILIGLYFLRVDKKRIEPVVIAIRKFVLGDFSARITDVDDDELKESFQGVNTHLNTLQDYLKKVEDVLKNISKASAKVFEIVKNLEVNILNQDAASQNIDKEVRDIIFSSHSFLDMIERVNRSIQRSNSFVLEGNTSLQDLQDMAEELKLALRSIIEMLTIMPKETMQGGQMMDSILGIVNESNLIALNTILKSSKLKNEAKGFKVVASHFKELADQTALSAFDTEKAFQNIQLDNEHLQKDIENLTRLINVHLSSEKVITDQLKMQLEYAENQLKSFEFIKDEMNNVLQKFSLTSVFLDDLFNATVDTDQTVRELYRQAENLYRKTTSDQ